MKKTSEEKDGTGISPFAGALKRRSFIKYAGVSAGVAALVLTGCNEDDVDMKTNEGVDLGSGDTGILNYAYALEQLEAAFYTTAVAHGSFASIFSADEQAIMTDIRDHEIAHREFFKTALGASAIQDLEVDFSAVNFGSRESVLMTAKTFEDLGVSAYNGAGNLLTDVNLLLVAGKIVSVEARHAAAIRDLLNPKSADFAGNDVVDTNGFDGALMPSAVLTAAGPFIKTKINGSNLPTT
ncbi:MAG: ferritin-like domain-containing protein [Cyclobacteriaceae bacterium]